MDISVIGAGYVGLVTGVCLAKMGNKVICVDNLYEKVEKINSGTSPIYENGLDNALKEVLANGTFKAISTISKAIADSEITFVCVGTPPKKNGSTDLSYIKKAAAQIGKALRKKNTFQLVIMKSTVPPGTCDFVEKLVAEKSGKTHGMDFGVASNPEFLKEGDAISDFFHGDRIVIGANDEKSKKLLEELYRPLSIPIVSVERKTSEMIKYASNAALATRISFANEIGNMCKQLGIDVYDVMKGVGSDKRIGLKFLNAGIGYGGSCFPKDVKSLAYETKKLGINPLLLKAVLSVNDLQPLKLVELAKKKVGSLNGKTISVLGLAFKPETDDMREAPSIKIIGALLSNGAKVVAYDPKAIENARKIFGDKITYVESREEALSASNIIFILTEWKEFMDENSYKGKIVFDGRKVLNKKSNGDYEGICW